MLLTNGEEPESYSETLEHERKEGWLQAIQEEMMSLYENHAYDLVKLPKGNRVLKNKWVYKLKIQEHSS